MMTLSQRKRGKRTGFTLIELISVLVLTGIIGGFSSLFLTTGVQSFIFAKNNADSSLKIAVALQRIDLEFRNMSAINTAQTNATQIGYTSNVFSNNRQLIYNAATSMLLLTVQDNGGNTIINQAPLLDNVTNFQITVQRQDLDRTTNTPEEVVSVSYSINQLVNGVTLNFTKQIRPRTIFR